MVQPKESSDGKEGNNKQEIPLFYLKSCEWIVKLALLNYLLVPTGMHMEAQWEMSIYGRVKQAKPSMMESVGPVEQRNRRERTNKGGGIAHARRQNRGWLEEMNQEREKPFCFDE